MPSQFAVYVSTPSSPQFFGDIVIIASASPLTGARYKGEAFVLVERCPTSLFHTRISANGSSVPSGVNPIDLDFVLDAALNAGKADIAGLLNARFEETKDWGLFSKPIDYQLVEPIHLARLWMMNKWHAEIEKIYDTSECEALIEWLNTVRQCPTVQVRRNADTP